MSELSKIEASVRPLLAPGEELDVAFPVRRPSLWLMSAEMVVIGVVALVLKLTILPGLPELVILLLLVVPYVQHRQNIVAATSTRIRLLGTKATNGWRATGGVAEFPRTTQLRPKTRGPVVLGGMKFRVNGQFRKAVELADLLREEHVS